MNDAIYVLADESVLYFLVRRPICIVMQKEKIKSKQCLVAVKEVR